MPSVNSADKICSDISVFRDKYSIEHGEIDIVEYRKVFFPFLIILSKITFCAL